MVQTPAAELVVDAGFEGDRFAAPEVRRTGDEGRLEYRFGDTTTDEYPVLVERLAESREARIGSDLLTPRAPAEMERGELAAVFQEIHDTGWYIARLETLD